MRMLPVSACRSFSRGATDRDHAVPEVAAWSCADTCKPPLSAGILLVSGNGCRPSLSVVILAVVDFETYRDCVVSGLEQYRRLCGVGGMRSEGDEELNLPW